MKQEFVDEKTPSENTNVKPLQSSILVNIENNQKLNDQKLQNQDSNYMTSTNINKRNEKQQNKQKYLISKLGQVANGIEQQENIHQAPSCENNLSQNDNLEIINQQFEKESESPMDPTVQSANSNITGMQFQGRWTQDEHQRFLEGMKMYGKDWKKIEDHIGSRTCAQIRSHAQKYFNKLQRDLKKGKPVENAYLSQLKREDKPKPLTTLEPETIKESTSKQLQQISETFSKIAEEDFQIKLQQKVVERELISKNYLTNKIDEQEACEQLIKLTNEFHQLALEALANSKYIFAVLVDMCNRMIDERNATQLLCIMLSKQVLVVPDKNSQHQTLQHIYADFPFDQAKNIFPILGQYEKADTARTSPQNKTVSENEHESTHHSQINQQYK